MTVELDSVKALLDAHLTAMRLEIQRLANNYDAITGTVQRLENNTNVAIAEIKKDVNSIGAKVDAQGVEIKAVKTRIEINEDVQQDKWSKQDVRNAGQETINQTSKARSDRLTNLLWTAIGTLLTLLVVTGWERLFPK